VHSHVIKDNGIFGCEERKGKNGTQQQEEK